MKLFNTLKELWDYCLFCPACQNPARTITLDIGPDGLFFNETNFYTSAHYLNIVSSVTIQKERMNVEFEINLFTNELTFIVKDSVQVPNSVDKASTPYFYLYFQGACELCHKSNVYTTDIELDILNKTIRNLKLELENVIFDISDDEIYRIDQEYDLGETHISRHKMVNGRSKIISTSKHLLMDFDFSDMSKTLHRLKTILVFS